MVKLRADCRPNASSGLIPLTAWDDSESTERRGRREEEQRLRSEGSEMGMWWSRSSAAKREWRRKGLGVSEKKITHFLDNAGSADTVK